MEDCVDEEPSLLNFLKHESDMNNGYLSNSQVEIPDAEETGNFLFPLKN